jgi:hypothetical protein
MMNRRKEKDLASKERRTQRSAREHAAGKLALRAPDLTSLSIATHETRPESVGDTRYIRRVVVAEAPALFEVPCSDAQCEDGGYDVTREILSALAARRTQFEGLRECPGHRGANACGRSLRYAATATYRDGRGAEPGKDPRQGTAAAT